MYSIYYAVYIPERKFWIPEIENANILVENTEILEVIHDGVNYDDWLLFKFSGFDSPESANNAFEDSVLHIKKSFILHSVPFYDYESVSKDKREFVRKFIAPYESKGFMSFIPKPFLTEENVRFLPVSVFYKPEIRPKKVTLQKYDSDPQSLYKSVEKDVVQVLQRALLAGDDRWKLVLSMTAIEILASVGESKDNRQSKLKCRKLIKKFSPKDKVDSYLKSFNNFWEIRNTITHGLERAVPDDIVKTALDAHRIAVDLLYFTHNVK